jgi:N-acetylglutamate synthase-like GNAT family acetyltransferase
MVAAAMDIKGLRAPVFVLKLASVVIGVLALLTVVPLIGLMSSVVVAPFRRGNGLHKTITNILWLIAVAVALEAVLALTLNYKL